MLQSQILFFVTDCSTSEEDGGFGVYGEKTRYATLQRLRSNNPQHGSHHHPNGGYETLRPNGAASAYNVPSLVNLSIILYLKYHIFIPESYSTG